MRTSAQHDPGTARKPRYLNTFTDRHGRLRVYFRRNGMSIPLPTPIFSDEFWRAYKLARGGDIPPKPPPRPAKPPSVVGRQVGRAPKIGVYLLFLKGAVVYVGASLNMPQRVAEHRSNGRPFDRAYFIATLAIERFVVERALIAALNPPQNRHGRASLEHRVNGAFKTSQPSFEEA